MSVKGTTKKIEKVFNGKERVAEVSEYEIAEYVLSTIKTDKKYEAETSKKIQDAKENLYEIYRMEGRKNLEKEDLQNMIDQIKAYFERLIFGEDEETSNLAPFYRTAVDLIKESIEEFVDSIEKLVVVTAVPGGLDYSPLVCSSTLYGFFLGCARFAFQKYHGLSNKEVDIIVDEIIRKETVKQQLDEEGSNQYVYLIHSAMNYLQDDIQALDEVPSIDDTDAGDLPAVQELFRETVAKKSSPLSAIEAGEDTFAFGCSAMGKGLMIRIQDQFDPGDDQERFSDKSITEIITPLELTGKQYDTAKDLVRDWNQMMDAFDQIVSFQKHLEDPRTALDCMFAVLGICLYYIVDLGHTNIARGMLDLYLKMFSTYDERINTDSLSIKDVETIVNNNYQTALVLTEQGDQKNMDMEKKASIHGKKVFETLDLPATNADIDFMTNCFKTFYRDADKLLN